jgi:WD40 repeat protein
LKNLQVLLSCTNALANLSPDGLRFVKIAERKLPGIVKMLKTLLRVLSFLWGSFCLLLALKAFAAENPVLAYLANTGQSSDIFAYDTASHLRINLSNSPYPEWSLTWSATGVLAYSASANPGEADAVFVSVDNALPQRLESLMNQVLVGLSLSPEGQSLLYFSSEPANYSEIYLIDLPSEHISNISNTPALSESAPQWLDNETILFLRDGNLYQTRQNSTASLLLDASFQIDSYRVSPDKRRIALHGSHLGLSELYLASSDGTKLEHIPLPLALSNEALSWSPDSQALVFTLVDGSLRIYYQGNLLAYPSEGRRISPIWSPDGHYIAFMEERRLYLLDWQNGAVIALNEPQSIRPPLFWMP